MFRILPQACAILIFAAFASAAPDGLYVFLDLASYENMKRDDNFGSGRRAWISSISDTRKIGKRPMATGSRRSAGRLWMRRGVNADRTEIVVHPGEAKDLLFTPKQAGHFRLVCPDHDWDGMTGKITVK